MNRRNMLVAAVGSMATLGSGLAGAMSSGHTLGGLLAGAVNTAGREESCALLPLSPPAASAAITSQVHMKRFFPNAVGGRSQLAHFTLDLRLLDARGFSRTVYAWQMRRRSIADSHNTGFRMQFQADSVEVVATIRPDGSRSPITWAGQVPRGTDSILVTPRLSTGRAPNAVDLRFDVGRQELSMADGSLRDFDAVLIHAA